MWGFYFPHRLTGFFFFFFLWFPEESTPRWIALRKWERHSMNQSSITRHYSMCWSHPGFLRWKKVDLRRKTWVFTGVNKSAWLSQKWEKVVFDGEVLIQDIGQGGRPENKAGSQLIRIWINEFSWLNLKSSGNQTCACLLLCVNCALYLKFTSVE